MKTGKKYLFAVAAMVFLCFVPFALAAQPHYNIKKGKARLFFNDMLYIPGDTFISGNGFAVSATPQDSFMLVARFPKVQHISDFYLCNHEVTNAEYREFTDWVRDSLAMVLLSKIDRTYRLSSGGLNWQKRNSIWANTQFRWDDCKEKDSAKMKALKPLAEKEPISNNYEDINPDSIIYTYTLRGSAFSLCIYPDIYVHQKEDGYRYGDPMYQIYFWHPGYDNHPVYGISKIQAEAYCHWLSWQYKDYLKIYQPYERSFEGFVLPSEMEWECAAVARVPGKKDNGPQNLYGFKGNDLMDKKHNYNAIFGEIRDKNGVIIKWREDNTSKTKSCPPNDFGLYDMSGNVAEWTRDTAAIPRVSLSTVLCNVPDSLKGYLSSIEDSLNQYTRITYKDVLQIALEKMHRRQKMLEAACKKLNPVYTKSDFGINSFLWQYQSEAFITEEAQKELHDAQLLTKYKGAVIVKGGSWRDGPAYLQCASREAVPANTQSSRIGFRVAIEVR